MIKIPIPELLNILANLEHPARAQGRGLFRVDQGGSKSPTDPMGLGAECSLEFEHGRWWLCI